MVNAPANFDNNYSRHFSKSHDGYRDMGYNFIPNLSPSRIEFLSTLSSFSPSTFHWQGHAVPSLTSAVLRHNYAITCVGARICVEICNDTCKNLVFPLCVCVCTSTPSAINGMIWTLFD